MPLQTVPEAKARLSSNTMSTWSNRFDVGFQTGGSELKIQPPRHPQIVSKCGKNTMGDYCKRLVHHDL
jgi:hypothetical protein